jgi:cell division protein FtsA
MAENELVAGLDIGTSKVCAVVAEQTKDGIDVVGMGSVPSKGLKKGVVVNIESTVQAIRAAVDQVETMAGCDVGVVYAGIGGSHVRGMNKEGFVAVTDREVKESDVKRVLEQCRAIPLHGDVQVIHVLPQQFVVDEQDGIRLPVGMSGGRLDAHVHVVTAASTSVQNIIKCAERCDLHVAEVVLQPLASAEAVLSEDEKEIGVALLDIGGGTTDVIVYVDGAVVHTSVIPIGGINLTNDIAQGLRTPVAEAERIKIKYGCASSRMIDADETIEVPSVGGRQPRVLARETLAQIIEPRVEEIFSAAHHRLVETGYYDMLASGIVLCGGATLLDGMPELGESLMGLPVRRGVPTGIGGLADVVRSPSYATAVGLVKYGAARVRAAAKEKSTRPVKSTLGKGRWIYKWFSEAF